MPLAQTLITLVVGSTMAGPRALPGLVCGKRCPMPVTAAAPIIVQGVVLSPAVVPPAGHAMPASKGGGEPHVPARPSVTPRGATVGLHAPVAGSESSASSAATGGASSSAPGILAAAVAAAAAFFLLLVSMRAARSPQPPLLLVIRQPG